MVQAESKLRNQRSENQERRRDVPVPEGLSVPSSTFLYFQGPSTNPGTGGHPRAGEGRALLSRNCARHPMKDILSAGCISTQISQADIQSEPSQFLRMFF